MKCQEVAVHLSAYVVGALEYDLMAGVRSHLAECPECCARAHVEEAVVAALRKASSSPAPTELRRRIMEALREQDAIDD